MEYPSSFDYRDAYLEEHQPGPAWAYPPRTLYPLEHHEQPIHPAYVDPEVQRHAGPAVGEGTGVDPADLQPPLARWFV